MIMLAMGIRLNKFPKYGFLIVSHVGLEYNDVDAFMRLIKSHITFS